MNSKSMEAVQNSAITGPDSDEFKKRVHCMIGTQGRRNCIDSVNEGRNDYVGSINKLVSNVTTETMLEINGTIMMLMLAKNL